MLELNKRTRRIENINSTESQNNLQDNFLEKFLNISPKNYIKVMEELTPKKSLIPMILISIMNRDNKIFMTLDELSKVLNYPKTGLSVVFNEYSKKDFIIKVRNGVYMINPLVSYKGSKYERDKLVSEYISLKDKNIEKNKLKNKEKGKSYSQEKEKVDNMKKIEIVDNEKVKNSVDDNNFVDWQEDIKKGSDL